MMDLLSRIDIFKKPIQLNINNDNSVATNFGTLITFFLLFYIVSTLLGSDLVLHQNPIFKSENIKPLMKFPIRFNYSNFIFAVGLFDESLGYVAVDPTVATFSARLEFFNNFNNTSSKMSMEMKICEEENFINAGEKFKNTAKENLVCFHIENETIDLFGSWNEKEIQFLNLELNRCINSTDKNYTCQSLEEQEKFLQGKYQDIIFQNDALEYSDYLHPIKKDVVKHYILIDTSFFKIIKASVKHFLFFSDDGFFFENFNRIDSYAVENLVHDIQSNSFEKKLPLVRIELSVDDQEMINSRKYQHIQDLLAEMGGVLNIFILFGLLLISIEIPYIVTKKISSELYSYDIDKKDIGKDEIKERKGEENKTLFYLSKFKNSNSKTRESLNVLDFPSTDVNSFPRKQIYKSEPLAAITEELPMSSIIQNKVDDSIRKTMKKEERISSNAKRANIKKVLSSKGDEERLHENDSEREISDTNRRIQKNKNSFPIEFKENKANSVIKTPDKRKSIIKSAVRFSVDLNKKFRRLLEYNTKKGKENFPINFLSYLFILFKCKRFKLKPREQLFLLGEQQIKKDLDVFKIINCMNDVEKLKMILLNGKQRYLFGLLQKPIITTNQINQEFEECTLIGDGIKKAIKQTIVEAFYKELIEKTEKSDIDKRILLLIDKNLVNLDAIHKK